MNFDKNVAGAELNALFDCRGERLSSPATESAQAVCPLAMVYGVDQQFSSLYEPSAGLSRGTLFAELDLPFTVGEGGWKR